MNRRQVTLGSDSILIRTAGDGIDYHSGPKGDKGDVGDTGATGATGADGAVGATGATGATGPVSYALIYWADFSDGISGSTGASGATAALTATDTYTSSDIWYPRSVIFHQTAASDDSNAATAAEVYVSDVALVPSATLSNLSGSGMYQSLSFTGGQVVTGDASIYLKATGSFSKVKVYMYGDKSL